MVEERFTKNPALESPGIKKIIHKRNVLLKEVENLEKLKTLHDTVTKFNNGYMKANLVKMRLTNVREAARHNITKEKKKRKSVSTNISEDSVLKSRWKDARQMGNDYSKLNKSNYFPTSLSNRLAKPNRSQIRLPKRRNLRNSSSQMTKSRMSNKSLNFYPSRSAFSEESMNVKYRRQQQMRYGSYYSLKNRLKLKDSHGQFDAEYDELLRKCTEFEKNHLEVCGFLEEKFYTDKNFRRRLINVMNQTQSPIQEVQPASHQKQPDQVEVKNAEQLMQAKHVEHVDEKHTYLSNALREVGETPRVEEFQSFTRVRLPAIQEVSSEVDKPETFVTTSTYSSCHQLNTARTTTQTDIADDESTLQPKPNDLNLQLIPGNAKADYFEDKIVEVIFQQPVDNNMSNADAQKLLFELYLTFWMSLMKTAIEEITKKEDIDIVYIKNCVARQVKIFSEILHRLDEL